jgi:MFS family permease
MFSRPSYITRTVIILSLVSLFADMASELLYPIVPVYLKGIGFSVFLIGVLEGVAEFTVGLSKGYFGKKSDEIGLRLPFVKLGYFLSALSKPLMALFVYPLWIFFARTTDRLGKGIRGAARDALLSQQTTKATKASVFGFHRSMDTVGAVLGPALALVFLYFYPGKYTTMFFLAFVPGIIAVGLIFLLNEKKQPLTTAGKGNFFAYFSYWKTATPEYRRLIIGLLIFAVANSSDVFLLLKAKEITQSDTLTIGAYIFYNLVYAISSYPAGILADKIGLKKVFIGGLLLFAVVYGGFMWNISTIGVFVLFFIYGIYAAATEGISKAWITNIASESQTATAIGFYTSMQSICALVASTVAGLLWSKINSSSTFIFSTVLTLIAIIYFRFIKSKKEWQK